MNSKSRTTYEQTIQSRTKIRFFKGLLPRYLSHLRNSYFIWVARRRGAIIGDCVTMSYALAKKSNSNLVVGHHSSIQTDRLDLRAKVEIGAHVIIGADVEIITASHNVDSPDWEQKSYGIHIDDYAWLATRAFILPSCRKIGTGAVCAAGSVVVADVAPMAIVAGNPAKLLRTRKTVHTDLCVESMLGNDYLAYVRAYRNK